MEDMGGRYLRVILLADGETVHNASVIYGMKIKYFQETDTLHIEFRDSKVVETNDLDENTLLDLDSDENICAITIEHAGGRTDIRHFSFEQVAV